MFFNNDYKILDVDNKINPRTKLSGSSYQKYSKILNNLLGISSRGDYAVFTKLNSLNTDLLKLIDYNDINTVFNKPKFKIKLKKELYFANNKRFGDDAALFLNKWKRYIKQVNETYQQTNMWPLFVGTYFLKGKPGDKIIYAPLVLKQVEIIIENNDVFLIQRDETVMLNEKLIFLLEEFQGITIPNIKDEIDKVSINEVISELNQFLKNSIEFEFTEPSNKFNELKSTDINNSGIIRTSGLVLLFAQPLGGVLRNVVIDLIKEDKINNLIKTDINNYLNSPDESIKNIVYKPREIARICPTDPSQENAIISSLNNNTIIIGPPGTGKSQTISNILANILLQGKKALFISQKRVALEVVLERMKSLQYFTLQLVEHKNRVNNIDEKNTFYDYMTNFMNLIRSEVHFNMVQNIDLKPLISYDKLQYWKSKDVDYVDENDINLFAKLKADNATVSKDMISDLDDIFNSLRQISRFNEIDTLLNNRKRILKDFASALNVPPKFSFLGIKKYDKSFKRFFDINVKLLNVIDKYNLNKEAINLLKDYDNKRGLLHLSIIYPLHQEQVPKNNPFISNEKSISKLCAYRAQNIYRAIHKKDPKWVSKFTGRIQRRFTNPSKFISLFKNELKQLFNIYVSTPEALSSFIDFKKDRFDYVIFDEASQIFLEKAIPYISIADKVIVAGDDQQMQPSNWFGHRSDVEDEEDKVDENVDSLLTYAIDNGINQEMLELNYRSTHAMLTTFSSKEFYSSNLKTLDKNGLTNKSIEILDVNGRWENNQNEIEADVAIRVLKENINLYKKIILLTFNKQQMELIDYKLSMNEPEIYTKIIEGDIILKNLENIQGDEADLVIASIAYTKNASLSSTYVGRAGGRNALNVAITRAKEKMIVIKSINSHEITTKSEMSKDLRTFKSWIEFLELNDQDKKSYALVEDKEITKDVESSFELDVVEWLKTKKFNKPMKLVVQYPIGSYRIDIAFIDPQTNKYLLGIEVDGFLYHSTIRQRYNDLVRQNFIEAKGYKLIRISEILWKSDKDKIFDMIIKNLD